VRIEYLRAYVVSLDFNPLDVYCPFFSSIDAHTILMSQNFFHRHPSTRIVPRPTYAFHSIISLRVAYSRRTHV
jgi:hypothetical protein